LKSFSKMSDGYKIALLASLFFLVNAMVSSNLEKLSSLPAYLIGFVIGIASAFVGYSLNKERRTFLETDVQIEVAIGLCKQLSALPVRVVKSTPSEVSHFIYAAKAYYPEIPKSVEMAVPEVKPKTPVAVEAPNKAFVFE